MKQIMKRLVPFMLAFVLLASCGAFAKAETADDAAEAAALMENIKGTYEALFPVITDPQYDQIWLDPCVAAAGEEAGPQMAEMLKAACNGTIYGQEAVDAFGDGSNGAQFDCAFINGVSTITFDGAVISGADENGNQVFSHEYTYAGSLSLGGMMEGYLLETVDEDAGCPIRLPPPITWSSVTEAIRKTWPNTTKDLTLTGWQPVSRWTRMKK